jgi:hypothetical protein
MALRFTTSYVEDSTAIFRYYKKLAERAMQQVSDDQLFAVLDDEMNSIAVIVKHMAGNMRSRWTDFLTSDGEKPGRDRDEEFSSPPPTREAHSVMQAINRQVAHYSYHCGQIVFLSKHLCHDRWQNLSVPRGASTEFTRRVRAGESSQR